MGEVQSETCPASELTWRRPSCGPRARMNEDAARAFDELVVFGSKVFGTCHLSRPNGSEPRYDTAIRSRRRSFVGWLRGRSRSDPRAEGSLERVLLNRSTCLGQAKCVARGHFRRRVIRPISPICTGGVLTEAPDSVPPVSTLASIALRNERRYPLPRSAFTRSS